MTASQTAAATAWIDRIYGGFIARVAQGRRLPIERVQEIAKGRVWTGAQAKDLGLVDHLGGFYDAVDRAKALGGVHGAARLVAFQAEASPLEAIRRFFGLSTEARGLFGAAGAVLAQPAARALEGELVDARLRAQGATVLAPRLLEPGLR